MNFLKHLFNRTQTSKGYTLLFAVIVSILVLSIAAFILSVSRKQVVLSSSARDSVYAFYAADSGLECAVENLSALMATGTPSINFNCAGKSIIATNESNNTAGTSSFTMFTGTGSSNNTNNTQSGSGSCASTTVAMYQGTDTNGSTTVNISVTSHGYNIGWNGTNCSLTGPRKVERALQYTLFQ